MSWSDIFPPARKEPKKKMNWACSACNRHFLKLENVRCHVLRNYKCSTRKATHVKLENNDPPRNPLRENRPRRVLNNLMENKDEVVIVQRPAEVRKKRTGVRPFPAALICTIAKEGKELAKKYGRRCHGPASPVQI